MMISCYWVFLLGGGGGHSLIWPTRGRAAGQGMVFGFEKAQKESRDLNSEDVEELVKQTLLSTEDVQIWVTHLDSVKKQRQAGARKAAATRKQKSAKLKSSDKVATAGNEFWCLCGGPESGNMIACDNPGCSIVVPFRMRGTCGCTKWKVALH